MRGHRPLSISRASSYSPLSSNSFASSQHSSARPPTSRFGFTSSRKSEACNVIVRTAVSQLRVQFNLVSSHLQTKKLRRSGLDAKSFVSLWGHKIVNNWRLHHE